MVKLTVLAVIVTYLIISWSWMCKDIKGYVKEIKLRDVIMMDILNK